MTSPACLGFTLWCLFATSNISRTLKAFAKQFFGLGHRAPKRQWTSQPVSCSSWRRRAKHSRGSESAAQRSVSLDFNVGVRSLSTGSSLEAMRLLKGDFYEILFMFFAYFAWISWRNPLWSTTEWIYGQNSKYVKISCDSQWHVRLRLNRFITQVPSGASLSPSCESPATKTANTKLISIIDL